MTLAGYETHVTEALGVEHVKGDTSFLGEQYSCDVRGGKVQVDFATCDKKGDKEIRKLQEEEAMACLEGTELEGTRPHKVQAWNMLGEKSENGKID